MEDSDSVDTLENIQSWTLLAQQMIAMAPEFNRERLKDAISNVAVKVNDRWADIQNELGVNFTADDLGIDLTGISDPVAVAFAGHTAVCLIYGMDGPDQMAADMRAGIDTLADEIEERG